MWPLPAFAFVIIVKHDVKFAKDMLEKSHKKRLSSVITMALVVMAVMVYCYPHPSVSHYKYEQGQPWNYAKLIAPFNIDTYLDSVTMKAKVDSVTKAHVPIYVNGKVNVDSLSAAIVKAMRNVPSDQAIPEGIPHMPQYDRFAANLKALLAKAYGKGVVSDSAVGKSAELRVAVSPTEMTKVSMTEVYTPMRLYTAIDSIAKLTHCHNALTKSGANTMLPASLTYDAPLNTNVLNENCAIFTAATGRILRGQTIIDKGAIITAQDYNNLQNYEKRLESEAGVSSRSDWLMVAGQIVVVSLLLVVFFGFVAIFDPGVWASVKSMTFILLLLLVFFLLEVLVTSFMPTSGLYLIPLAIVPMLITVYFNGRLGLMTGYVLTLLCAGLTTFPLEFILVQFAGMSMGIYALRDLTQRSQLLRASVLVIATGLLSYTALGLMLNGSFDDFSWRMFGAICAGGALTSMAYVMMSLVERAFGFISNVTLVELADTNTPLLRQLSDECPGTFQHCIAVSNLAGDAARLIGANTLLVRAGAMYHDIGKLSNPVFFTENQHGVNPHDGLSPMKSAEIIISHVTDGLKRADKAGLPAVIKNFISQHHGAGKAKYFYFTYCKQHPDEVIDPAPFTYPGPNPRSRETSVLMMADSVEAASRSLPDFSAQSIRSLVDKIIDGQIADGLHNDSPLSFRDVQIIKDAFTRRLMTIYHSRISYPEDPTRKTAPAANQSATSKPASSQPAPAQSATARPTASQPAPTQPAASQPAAGTAQNGAGATNPFMKRDI